MFILDPLYFLFLAPALLLAGWASWRVRATYNQAMQIDARLSGAAAARYILDEAGCYDVGIEEVDGFLTDHYDPSQRVLRLSPQVFHEHSAASVGIAAHEAGHAMQHATGYAPLVIRNMAVPAAEFGPTGFIVLFFLGMILGNPMLMWAGIICYSALALFQLVNLPVEFDASNRAKRILDEYQIVDGEGSVAVRKVLNAAGWTYVAATLQTILTLAYYILIVMSGSRRD